MFAPHNPRKINWYKPLIMIALLALACGAATAADGPRLAPAPTGLDGAHSSGPAAGFVPPTFQSAHFAPAAAKTLNADKVLPASYDARALGQVTPVKNQGNCGACYAFSSAADLESKILAAGLGTYDLSEESMKDCNYQGTGCAGGNQFLIMNYLATHGAELESCVPYVAADQGCPLGCGASFTVLDFSAISGSTVAPTAVIKQYLMDFGPIHTTLFAGDDTQPVWRDQMTAYDGTGTLTYTGTEVPNHSVVIVGWDDSIVHALGTGAWIVKNSWGTTWGGTCGYGTEKGYFYIAYGSANIGMYSSFVREFMSNENASTLLYHDEGGYTSAFGGLGTTLWGMGAYTAPANTRLHRVEFWTSDATVDVDVYIYRYFTGGNLTTLLASSLNNSFAEPGYHFVQLDTPLDLAAGEDFYVAVRFENQTYQYPLAADGDGPADIGKSWYSFNGSTWSSLESYGVDNTIRVRTSPNTVLAVDDRDRDPGDEVAPPRSLEVRGAFPNPFNPTTKIAFALPRTEQVRLAIFDMQGRLVRHLAAGVMTAGDQSVTWDGQDDQGAQAPSGIYFCQVVTASRSRSLKLALLK